MITVDTNVLLRHLLNDDLIQSSKARKIFARHDSILITDIVLVETIWTLKGKRYKASKEDICTVITRLLEESNVVFENQQAVWSALNEYMTLPSVDFSDTLLINKAKALIEQWGESYGGAYTFDQAAQALHGAKIP
jgi:predicted nucleic-acid-binding protein